jgi:hypothetical protein
MYRTGALLSPIWASHFGNNFQLKFHEVLDLASGHHFFDLLTNLTLKVQFLDPLWHPAGSKMAPQIGHVALKNSKSNYHALTFWGHAPDLPQRRILERSWSPFLLFWGGFWDIVR